MTSRTGKEGFLEGLAQLGLQSEIRSGLVVYKLEAVAGSAAGQPVDTGVAETELVGWPNTPPHWLHFPAEITLPGPQGSECPGWSKYSRPHPGRLDASPAPTREWVAHVREFLGHAC